MKKIFFLFVFLIGISTVSTSNNSFSSDDLDIKIIIDSQGNVAATELADWDCFQITILGGSGTDTTTISFGDC